MTDEQDLTAYLRSKGVQVHRASGSEVTAHCMWCSDGDTKGKGKLYLNTETWLYSCKRCDEVGNRRTLLAHFGDEDERKYIGGNDPALRRQLLDEAASLAHEMLLANESKTTYLLERGIAPELIVQHRLGYVPKNVGISDMLPSRKDLQGYRELIHAGLVTVQGREFFNDCITIPYFSHGSVVQVRAKFVDGKYLTTTGDHVRLHNADALFGADEVLITEGELDDFAVRSAIMKSGERSFEGLAVVGLPGANAWPDHLVDMLSGARKIFIGLDSDDTGKKAAAKLKDAIGSRARVIDLPGNDDSKCDWTDYLKPHDATLNPYGGHTWRDVRDLMVEADLAGKQMFSVGDARAKWRKRQVEAPGLKLGWPSLDSIIRPGIKPGQVVIPLAKSGTGKSVWLSNVSINLRQHHVLYASLELTAAEVYEHWRRIHRFHYPKADEDQLLVDLARLRVVERNRLKRGDLEILINEYEEDLGRKPELVIVDYLQYYARGFAGMGGMYERVSEAAMELKAVAKENNLAIICPSQVNRGGEHGKPLSADDARDSGVVDETGDFVFSLFRPDQLQNKDDLTGALPMQSGNFNLQILKSRHGGKGHLSNLRMSLMSLAIVDAVFDRPGSSRVEQENSLYRQGMHYDDYRKRLDDAVAQHTLAGVG